VNLTLSCTTGVPLGRRPACTWCPLRASTKRTVRSVPFGSLAEWDSCFRSAASKTASRPRKTWSTNHAAARQSPKAPAADPAGRRFACTWCRIRSLTNSTYRNGIRLAGRMGFSLQVCQRADRHNIAPRVVNEPRSSAPIAEGTNRRSGGRGSAGRGCHLARSACSTLASRRAASTTLCSAISSAR
jgi:hypothetical protein